MSEVHVALLNRSDLIAGHEADMRAMMEAGLQLVNDTYAPLWHRLPISGAFYERASDIPDGACIFTWVDSDADVPDAMGYHDQAHNRPYSVLLAAPILKEAKGGIIDVANGGCSCASVWGHELLELVVNPNVNEWVEMPDGRFLAKEVCDPVQDQIVLVTLPSGIVVAMSDGVLPEYFDAQAPRGGVYSINGFSVPQGRTEGGYQIIYDPRKLTSKGGPISSEWGALVPQWQIRDKSRRGRTARRLGNV